APAMTEIASSPSRVTNSSLPDPHWIRAARPPSIGNVPGGTPERYEILISAASPARRIRRNCRYLTDEAVPKPSLAAGTAPGQGWRSRPELPAALPVRRGDHGAAGRVAAAARRPP